MMNIVHVEGIIYGLDMVKASLKNTNQHFKYDVLIVKENEKLFNLTGDNSPEVLVLGMRKSSE